VRTNIPRDFDEMRGFGVIQPLLWKILLHEIEVNGVDKVPST
jgi:hypothetical protein